MAEPSIETTDLPGRVLDGRYRILEQLGAGAMGAVHRAEQLNVGRQVAIKVLARAVANSEKLVQRFENEAEIISRLRHPNTLKLIDIGRLEDGRLYIVMELLEGEPFNVYLARHGRLEVHRALEFLRAAADALEEAHQHGIIHRDIKPENLFVERVGSTEVLKVLDFGIARLGDTSNVTATGSVFGTPAYMSPEQARGDRVDPRSDLYSLGIVLYHCLTGHLPFEASTPVALLFQHNATLPPPMAEFGVAVPNAVEALVRQLLEKEPDERLQSAAELVDAIDKIKSRLSTLPVISEATRPNHAPVAPLPGDVAETYVPASVETPENGRRRSGLVMAIGLGLAVGAIAGVVGLLRSNPAPTAPPPEPAAIEVAVEPPSQPKVEPSRLSPPPEVPAPKTPKVEPLDKPKPTRARVKRPRRVRPAKKSTKQRLPETIEAPAGFESIDL